LMSF